MVGKYVSLSPSAKDKIRKQARQYETVFLALAEPLLPRGYVATLSRTTGLKERRLYGWRSKLREDKNWRPFVCHYGQHRRHFTPTEEQEIIAKIKIDWLDKGLFYSDQDFRVDMQVFYQEYKDLDRRARQLRQYYTDFPNALREGQAIPAEPRRRPGTFTCSCGFIRRFRRRHRISLRRPTMKRRPKPRAEEILKFRDRVTELEERYPNDLIFNMDETNFHLVNMKHLTWAVTGADAVTCYNQNDIKSNVTVIATIDREGGKLPLMVVAKGKDQRSLKKYGELLETGDVWSALSESGWTRENVMLDYLRRLSKYVSGRKCALQLDV